MKLVKSLLLGSAAGLAATVGAQAADLPFRKAAPVEYVRVCDWTGAGFFYIPGTDTCLKLSGAVRAEYAFVEPERTFSPTPFGTLGGVAGVITPGRLRSGSGFFARGKLEADARSQTAYGVLRGFVRIQADRYDGNYSSGGPYSAAGPNPAGIAGGNTSAAYLDKAYITFAGISAGRFQSFFDLYADNYNFNGIANSDESAEVLAYTATFGGGFSATISVEDPNGPRRDGIGAIAFGNNSIGATNALVVPVNGNTVGYAGDRYPDAVIQLRLDQAWGAVQLSGAYHDINTISSAVDAHTDDSGFAVQAGVDIKLPMLAAGDELFLEGAYQDGAYLYQDSGANVNSSFYGSDVGGFQHFDHDAVAVGIPGTNAYTLAHSRGFSVMAALHHYFTPQFHDVLYGSYEEVSYGNVVKNIDWARGGLGDASQYKIGNQFIFTPVHNLDIGLDVMYTKIDQTLAHEVGFAPSLLPVGISRNPDAFEARLRLERDF